MNTTTISLPPRPSDDSEAVPPWERADFLPVSPLDSYGYAGNRSKRAGSLEEVRSWIGPGGVSEKVFFAWRPGEGRMRPVAEMPEFFDALRAGEVALNQDTLHSKLKWAFISGLAAWYAGPMILMGMPRSWIMMLWACFFVLPVVDCLFRSREWKHTTAADGAELGRDSRFIHWLSWQRSTKLINVLIGLLVVTFILSESAGLGRAVAEFAMSESGVREGRWWQPLTCFFLHGGIVHILFNSMAMLRLGRWVETLTQPLMVPLILVASTLGGSLAGYVLPPDVPSVGASGGVLGLLGFLIVYCRPPERRVPGGFRRQLWQWVIYVAVLGAIGWSVIDNAGHLGGLMAGACLGGLANATLPATIPPTRAGWVTIAGGAALALLAVTGVWMSWRLWEWRV